MASYNRVALITGGATGIGKAVAIDLVKHGYAVVIVYNRSSKAAKTFQADIQASGGTCAIYQADVTCEQQVKKLLTFCEEEFGRIDALVNSAGTTSFVPLSDFDSVTGEMWDTVLRTNIEGTFFCSRDAAKLMQENGGGVIVNIASLSGIRVRGSSLPYCISKAGVIHLTKCMAVSLAPNIRVNCVSPGTVTGTAWNRDREDYDAQEQDLKNGKQIPLGRVATAQDVANVILFLLSDEAKYLTGINILVDGGRAQVQV